MGERVDETGNAYRAAVRADLGTDVALAAE
jgi:hypothetical protein